MEEDIISYINESLEVKKKILDKVANIKEISNLVGSALRNKKKLLIAGNGGSAADSQHFAAELVGRYKLERKGLPAISLTTDTSNLTAISNDYGYSESFRRQVEALGDEGDLFIAFSTSGNSENLIKAIEEAKTKGIITISFLGKSGGKMKEISDYSFVVPSENTPRIQEVHILLIHIVCELVERELFKNESR